MKKRTFIAVTVVVLAAAVTQLQWQTGRISFAALSRGDVQNTARGSQDSRAESDDDSTDHESNGRALPVRTMLVQEADSYRQRRDFTGTIVAGRTSDIGFEASGKIVAVHVEQGQRVLAGDTLAVLDTRQLRVEIERAKSALMESLARLQMLRNGARKETIAAAKADVRSQESDFQLQSRDLGRQQKLLNSRAVSASVVDQSRFGTLASRAQRDAAQARLDELQAGTRSEEVTAQEAVVDQLTAAYKAAHVRFEDAQLTAPFAGTISQRNFDEGSVVSAGQPVLRIVEDEALEAHIGVPARLTRNLHKDQRYDLVIANRVYSATFRCALPEINAQTQTRTTIFDLRDVDPSGRPAIGEMARVEIGRQVQADGFWLPATAIQRGARGLWTAFAVDSSTGDTVAQRRDVEVLHTDEDRVFARGTLKAGEQVIVSGLHRLSANQLVVVVPESNINAKNKQSTAR